uniref:hypothetical protein n=1 Tax=Listeria costaricensis TaxID=2026604 RepID=UPI0013C3E7D6
MKKSAKKVLVGLLAVNVLASAPLTAISVNAEEVQAGVSENHQLKTEKGEAVNTLVGLEAPTLSSVNEESTSITVKGEPNAQITLILPKTGLRVSTMANAEGEATFALSGLVANDVIRAIQELNGQISPEGSTIVQGIEIDAPIISEVTTDDTIITVTGKPYARISIVLPNGSTRSRTADADGKTTFDIEKQNYGGTITATQIVNGRTSVEASIMVTQGEVAAPTIQAVTTDDTTITVTGNPYARISIVLPGGSTRSKTADADGKVIFDVEKQNYGGTITATQTVNGRTSAEASVIVTQGEIAAPTIQAVTTDDTT